MGAMTLAATYSVVGVEAAQAKDSDSSETAPAVKPAARREVTPIAQVIPAIAPPESFQQPAFIRSAEATEGGRRRAVSSSLQRLQETRLNTAPINRADILQSASKSAASSTDAASTEVNSKKAASPQPLSLDAADENLRPGAAPGSLPAAATDASELSTGLDRTQRFTGLTVTPSRPILAAEIAAAATPPEADSPTQYEVQKGDTLHKIANSLGLSLEDLVNANDIDDPNVIIAGVELVLPTANTAELNPVEANAVEADVVEANVVEVERGDKAADTEAAIDNAAVDNAAIDETAPSDEVDRSIAISDLSAQDRLTHLQATAGRPVDSVTLLSQLQGKQSRSNEPVASNGPGENVIADSTETEPSDEQGFEQAPEQTDVYLASLLESVSATSSTYQTATGLADTDVTDRGLADTDLTDLDLADTDVTGSDLTEPPEASSAEPGSSLTARSTDTLLAAAPLDSAEWLRRQAPRAGDSVDATTPFLPGADEFLPQPSGAFNGYIWPTQGTLTSGYGWRWGRLHKGVDIAAPVGTPVMAAAPGVVEYAQWNNGGYGNLVDIRHADGSMTRYAHNNRLVVRPGQQVQQGQLIAEMGSTGYSTGPHLHFEIHPANSGATNPLALLPNQR